MVVVGVVLNPKQAQNEEVSKAIDMLQRNGVSCVYFALKDSPQTCSKIGGCQNHNCFHFFIYQNLQRYQIFIFLVELVS